MNARTDASLTPDIDPGDGIEFHPPLRIIESNEIFSSAHSGLTGHSGCATKNDSWYR